MVIAIAGYKGTGKSTLATALANEFSKGGYEVEIIKFADPIKDATQMIFGFTNEQVYGEEKDVVDPFWGFTPRDVQLSLGTEWGREMVHPDIWVKALEQKIKHSAEIPYRLLIIDDLRFVNEARMLKVYASVLLRVENNRVQQDKSHPTETGLDEWTDWDYIVDNNTTYEELNTAANTLYGLIHTTWYPG